MGRSNAKSVAGASSRRSCFFKQDEFLSWDLCKKLNDNSSYENRPYSESSKQVTIAYILRKSRPSTLRRAEFENYSVEPSTGLKSIVICTLSRWLTSPRPQQSMATTLTCEMNDSNWTAASSEYRTATSIDRLTQSWILAASMLTTCEAAVTAAGTRNSTYARTHTHTPVIIKAQQPRRTDDPRNLPG